MRAGLAVYFIGSGALLSRVVQYSLAEGLRVDGICCPPGDPSAARLHSRAAVVESDDPNADAQGPIAGCGDGIVFSVNNRHILGDGLLLSGPRFFNIHSGLIQHYRGIAEVCIFAALCQGEEHYGVTLHELLPHQKVDSGPVVAQIEFRIAPTAGFADVLRHTLDACLQIFEANVREILKGTCAATVVEPARHALSYQDIPALSVGAGADRLRRARDLGPYAGLLPKLRATIDSGTLAGSSTIADAART